MVPLLAWRKATVAMTSVCHVEPMRSAVGPEGVLIEQGLSLIQSQRFDAAAAVLRKAASLNPTCAEAWNSYGTALQHLGRHQEAVETHLKAVEIDPLFAEAYNNLGVALSAVGQWGAAFDAFDRGVTLDADNNEAVENRAAVLRALNERVTGADPGMNGARELAAMAVRYFEGERYIEALAFLTALIALRPADLDVRFLHLKTLLKLELEEQAATAIEQLANLDPANAGILEIEISVLQKIGKLERAHWAFKRLIALKPDLPNTVATATHFALAVGDWTDMALLKRKSLETVENDAGLVAPLTLCDLTSSAALQLKGARAYIAKRAEGIVPLPPRPVADVANRKLRIGYMSADFRNHPVSYLMAEVIEAHDRERFEIVGYTLGVDDNSTYRQRLRQAFGGFIETKGLKDEVLAQKIRDDGIDILVDLMGLTKDARTRVLAFRPAPVQVNYLGFPSTMGADFIDYIIADRVVIPLGAEAFYAEKVVRLPHCYQPNDRLRLVAEKKPSRAEAGLPEDAIVFANLAQVHKINPDTFGLWLQAMAAVPGSVLWLLDPRAEAGRYMLRRTACDFGIDPLRLVFAPRVSPPEHLARLHLADLVLDTFPYTSHTTASEYLLVDTPVLTIEGESFASRVCVSILHHLGTDELITPSAEAFVARAVALARAPAELKALRAKIARCRAGNILFDGTRFARSLERVYVRMAEHSAAGLAPQGFDLEA